MARPASASAIRDILSNSYPDKFLECRELGHSWRRVGVYRVGAEIKRLLVCGRCEARRTSRWTSTAKIISNAYVYADDYVIEGGGVKAQYVREAVIGRYPVYNTEQEMLDAVFANGSKKARR